MGQGEAQSVNQAFINSIGPAPLGGDSRTVTLEETHAHGEDWNCETGERSSFVRQRVRLSDGPAYVELTVNS
jgi:hypothetical protein